MTIADFLWALVAGYGIYLAIQLVVAVSVIGFLIYLTRK